MPHPDETPPFFTSFNYSYGLPVTITEKLAKLDSLKSSIDGQRPIDPEQERRVMQKFRLDWNYHSNAIEGNSLSLGETAALLSYGLTAKGKPLKDHLDISGHDHVLAILADLVRDVEPLTEHTIRAFHEMLLGGTRDVLAIDEKGDRTTRTISAGKYKTAPNHVETETGVIRIFASPVDTPVLMQDLLHWYRTELTEKKLHPVVFAATFHHRFVSIHPFDDGNGRMARILMNLILMQRGYLPAVFRISDRDPYISALVQADQGEFAPLIELLADASIRSADLFKVAITGGAIDDLGDFDKQLALISQSILSEQNTGATPRTQAQTMDVIEGLVLPVFRTIASRLHKLESLFASVNKNYIATLAANENFLQFDLADFGALLPAATNGKSIIRLQQFFNATGFVKNATKELLVAVSCNFNEYEFSITSIVTGALQKEIFIASYDQKYTQVDIDLVAKKVLPDIVIAIRSIAGVNI